MTEYVERKAMGEEEFPPCIIVVDIKIQHQRYVGFDMHHSKGSLNVCHSDRLEKKHLIDDKSWKIKIKEELGSDTMKVTEKICLVYSSLKVLHI